MDENELSHEVIGAAIEVHKVLGPGLLEIIYEEALVIELDERGFEVVRQAEVEVSYKGRRLDNKLRLDIMVNGLLIIEVKSSEHILPVHEAQLLSYLRLSGKKRPIDQFQLRRSTKFHSPHRQPFVSCLPLRPLRPLRLCVEV